MGPLLSGVLALAVSAGLVWWLLPRGGPAKPLMRSGFAGEMTGFLIVGGFAFGVALIAASAVLGR
jgi:hypothetical protein